jgi:hypothetical protein
MTHTLEQIELIDKVFDFYIEHHYNGDRRTPTAELFSTMFKIDKITAQFAIN